MLAGVYDCFQHWHTVGTVWISSDPHFNDLDQRKMCKTWPQDDDQVKIINSCIGKNDTWICLGDVGDIEFAKKIRAKHKVLICGNHDVGATKYADVFDEVYKGALIIGEKLILSHEPIIGINWALNIHGHKHDGVYHPDVYHYNVCSNVIGFKPINFNAFLKAGHTAKIETIHRQTIDKATKRKRKR